MSPSTMCHVSISLAGSDLVLDCVRGDASISHHISSGAAVLDRLARNFQSVVALRSFSHEADRGVIKYVQDFGRELHEVFLKPLEVTMAGCTDLVVHHETQIVPLELAFDGKEFLSTRMGISNTAKGQNTPKSWQFSGHDRDFNVLCIGQEGDLLSRAIYSQARYANYECITHAKTNQVLGRLEANNYSIIHFAGHGIYDEADPRRQFLVLDPERAGQNESAVLKIGDLETLGTSRLRGSLVFLNACYSGVINDKYQGFVGFAGPLLESGASSCIVTLWSISDDGASNFARDFYREALNGMPVSQALRSTRLRCWHEQRDVLTSLSYVLFGEPNTVLTTGASSWSGTSQGFES